MGERLPGERVEQMRRALAMSPTLPAPVAAELVAEVTRMQAQLVAILDEVDEAMAALRRIQQQASRAAE